MIGQVFAKPVTELFATHRKAASDYLEYRREIEGIAADLAARRATVGRSRAARPHRRAHAGGASLRRHGGRGGDRRRVPSRDRRMRAQHHADAHAALLLPAAVGRRAAEPHSGVQHARRQRRVARPASGDLQGGAQRRPGWRRAARRWITSPMSNRPWPRPSAPATGSAWRACACGSAARASEIQ